MSEESLSDFLRQRSDAGQSRLRLKFQPKHGSGKERQQMKKVLVAAVALTLILSAVAFAGNNPNAKMAVHVKAYWDRQSCANLPVITGCADILTTYAGADASVFPVFYDLTEYKGCEYGLTWPAWTYSANFKSCSDLTIGGIAWPGDEISHAWEECQPYTAVVTGYARLTADTPGMICPIPYSASIPPGISVLDCAEGLDYPCDIFCAGVNGLTGDDPCSGGASATEQSTWGEIKAIFE